MKKNILIVNHNTTNCGVYQYGKRISNILKNLLNYNITYVEVNNLENFLETINLYKPDVIVYNYTSTTLPFITRDVIHHLRNKNIKQCCIVHNYKYEYFDFYFHQDPNFIENNNNFKLLRPLFNYSATTQNFKSDKIKIGSFGFGFKFKKYDMLCKLINDQFNDEQIEIKLHLTDSFYGKNCLEKKLIENSCYQQITKPNITLKITTEFVTDEEILNFLNENDLNVFLYENYDFYNGISSVIDYALSVKKPIAICKSNMFSHILDSNPSICIEDVSLKTIINNNTSPLNKYYDLWSCENFKLNFENIITKILT